MNKAFAGFNTMALALAAAGLAPMMGVPVAAALITRTGRYKFLLLSWSKGSKKHWVMQSGDDGLYYECGHDYGQTLDSGVVVYEEKWLNAWSDLSMEDRKKQGAWVEGGKAGWLSPTGEFYSCNYEGHSRLARQVIQRKWSDLEREGWVHVDGAGQKGCYTYRSTNYDDATGWKLTPEQEKWLEANGHDLDPFGKKKRKELPQVVALGESGEYKIDADADAAAFKRQMEKAGIDISAFGREKPTRLRDFR